MGARCDHEPEPPFACDACGWSPPLEPLSEAWLSAIVERGYAMPGEGVALVLELRRLRTRLADQRRE